MWGSAFEDKQKNAIFFHGHKALLIVWWFPASYSRDFSKNFENSNHIVVVQKIVEPAVHVIHNFQDSVCEAISKDTQILGIKQVGKHTKK